MKPLLYTFLTSFIVISYCQVDSILKSSPKIDSIIKTKMFNRKILKYCISDEQIPLPNNYSEDTQDTSQLKKLFKDTTQYCCCNDEKEKAILFYREFSESILVYIVYDKVNWRSLDYDINRMMSYNRLMKIVLIKRDDGITVESVQGFHIN